MSIEPIQYWLLVQASTTKKGLHLNNSLQHIVQIFYVTNGKSEDFDLGQLLVRRQRWQELPEAAEGRVEGLDPHPFPEVNENFEVFCQRPKVKEQEIT